MYVHTIRSTIHFGIKCIEVCACISIGIAKFLHHISDALDLR